jgi:MSHA biogenesis protein MshE
VRRKIRLGDLLVRSRLVTQEQLETALTEQKKTGRKLGQTLVELGFMTEDRLLSFLSKQLRVPFVDLSGRQLPPKAASPLPETLARRFRAIVVEQTDANALVGMADPTDILAVDELTRTLKRSIQPAIVRESELLAAIDRIYRRTSEITSLAEELGEELTVDVEETPAEVLGDASEDSAVARLVRSLFEDAVQVNASDIHIEPDLECLRIRQRVDGVLQEHVMQGSRVASALVLRLKLMAGLDISEKRLPQDGRFEVTARDRKLDVRLSTMPVQYGESVVMRLLDQSEELLRLGQLGMPERVLEQVRRVISQPHGLLLVTGPTGSGKTTTLYGALSELNQPEHKIITVEDPVEYRLKRINQVQVNPRIDLSFAKVLRAALRQDPDVLMIGEMRDQETAQIGLRAAMTGHLVLSTLHTNDAISTATRLLDMGAEPYLVASSLRGVLAQRLVRRICRGCPQPHKPDEHEKLWLTELGGEEAANRQYGRGTGCSHCQNTGYRGRIGVYEFLENDAAVAEALRLGDAEVYQRVAREQPSFTPLGFCALEYARNGVTSLEEVCRLMGEQEISQQPESPPVPEEPVETPDAS